MVVLNVNLLLWQGDYQNDCLLSDLMARAELAELSDDLLRDGGPAPPQHAGNPRIIDSELQDRTSFRSESPLHEVSCTCRLRRSNLLFLPRGVCLGLGELQLLSKERPISIFRPSRAALACCICVRARAVFESPNAYAACKRCP